MSTVSVGGAAEQAVSEELVRHGYTIVDRNWRTKWCEVDIIARKNGIMWFIEVKYRATSKFGDGLEYIGPQKIMHMERAAEMWVSANHWEGEYSLAAVSVTGDSIVGDIIELE